MSTEKTGKTSKTSETSKGDQGRSGAGRSTPVRVDTDGTSRRPLDVVSD